MKFRGHETFFIRKGWLSKGMKAVKKDASVFVNKEENPIDVLGIGSNMVKSLRYWLQAAGMTKEPAAGKKLQSFTEFGKCIYEHDRYNEELGTLYLLHYKLASNKENATAWYYFFNEFTLSEFTKEDFISAMQNYLLLSENKDTVAVRSLNDDFICIVNTYSAKNKYSKNKTSPESNIDCPLGELGLVDVVNREKRTFKKALPNVDTIDPWVALSIIVDQSQGRKEIALNELLCADCNIGKVFNLDAILLLDVLYKIEKLGEIKIIRTAGLDVIRILNDRSFQECVDCYYSSLGL